MDYASKFWSENEQYHDLAEEYERNIKITHPSGASCVCGDNCPFAATKVTYYKYNGSLP